jgi:hypothetical protein
MSLEHRSEAGPCDPARGALTPGEPFGGWEMVQSDWGSRQHELGRSRVIAALRTGLATAAGWLRRLGRALVTTVGGGSGTPRSSAPRS